MNRFWFFALPSSLSWRMIIEAGFDIFDNYDHDDLFGDKQNQSVQLALNSIIIFEMSLTAYLQALVFCDQDTPLFPVLLMNRAVCAIHLDCVADAWRDLLLARDSQLFATRCCP